MPALAEEEQRKLRDAAEDYQSTVHAMLAFAAFVVHDATELRPNSHFGFGRRMETSKNNAVVQESAITPDIVAQKSGSFGVVGEVKRSLPSDRTKWPTHIRQIRKYDDDLTGWWTDNARIAESDTTLLLHQSRSRAFINVLEEERKKDDAAVGPHTSVIEFNRSEERLSNYFFRLEWGAVRDAELFARLKEGVPVPIEKVIRTFANVKFYDADPPLHWLLQQLWMDYFPPLAAGIAYDENLKAFPIDVDAADIADELQRAYGSQLLERDDRSVAFPSITVIRKALEALVAIKLAMALPNGNTQFRVLYRQFNEDVLMRFGAMLKTPAEKVTEQTLFPFEQAAVASKRPAAAPNRSRTPDTKKKPAATTKRKTKKQPSKSGK